MDFDAFFAACESVTRAAVGKDPAKLAQVLPLLVTTLDERGRHRLDLLQRAVTLGTQVLPTLGPERDHVAWPEVLRATLRAAEVAAMAARDAGALDQSLAMARAHLELAKRYWVPAQVDAALESVYLAAALAGRHAQAVAAAREHLDVLTQPEMKRVLAATPSAPASSASCSGYAGRLGGTFVKLGDQLRWLARPADAATAYRSAAQALGTSGCRDMQAAALVALVQANLAARDATAATAAANELVAVARDSDMRLLADTLQVQIALEFVDSLDEVRSIRERAAALVRRFEAQPRPATTSATARRLAMRIAGSVLDAAGQPSAALGAYRTALAGASAAERGAGLWLVARSSLRLGHYQEALEALRMLARSDHLAARATLAQRLMVQLELARLEGELGHQPQAEQAWDLAGRLAAQLASLAEPTEQEQLALAEWRLQRGQADLLAGQVAPAAQLLQAAHTVMAKLGGPGRQAEAAVWATAARLRLARTQGATEASTQVRSLQKELGAAVDAAVASLDTAALLVALPELTLSDGRINHHTAAIHLREARQAAEARGLLRSLPELNVAEANALAATGQTADARERYLRALDLAEARCRGARAADAAIRCLEASDSAYAQALDFLVRQDDVPAAIAVVERAHAQEFEDLLASSTPAPGWRERAKVDAWQADWESLMAQGDDEPSDAVLLDHAQGALSPPPPVRPQLTAAAAAELRAQQRDRLTGLIAHQKPWTDRPGELAGLAAAPALAQEVSEWARQRRAVVVVYHAAATALYVLVVPPVGAPVARVLPVGRAELAMQVGELRRVLGPVDPRGPPSAAAPERTGELLAWLHARLVAPIAGELRRDVPILIVPHGPLAVVPFAALAAGPQAAPLAVEHPLTMVPALAVLRQTNSHRGQAAVSSPALLVGNPPMPEVGGAPLPPLPAAEREVHALVAQLGPQTRMLAGEMATEPAVRAAMVGARWIHVASHCQALDGRPLEAFVALGPDEASGSDGRLTLAKVARLALRSDLVSLSGCQTGGAAAGAGDVPSGAGLQSLVRAFAAAGTPSLLVSLWPASDDATTWQVQTFYRELAVGQSKARALQAAQLATRVRFPAPSDWAGFVLVGEGE